MAAKPLPSPEVLRQLLRYEPETGKLFWRERGIEWFQAGNTSQVANWASWNKRQAGQEAFTSNSHGYRSSSIFGRRQLAHRVIWAIHYGHWPESEIDHVNGDRSDNRLCNLREANSAENKRNTGAQINNTSGFKCVTWHRQRQRWTARISVNGENKYLGLFDTAEAAYAAYCAAAEKYHGEFARFE